MRFFQAGVLCCSLALSQIVPGQIASAQPLTATFAETPRLSALQKMPIKELTVFKDGHAFVLHEGEMPTDGTGNVLLDYLPTPVIGTFWAYSSTPAARLNSVTASSRRTIIERTALNLRELLEANIGASVVITENAPTSTAPTPEYSATILAIPQRSSSELEITGAPLFAPTNPRYDDYGRPLPPVDPVKPLPQKGDIILLQTENGVRAIPVTQIRNVTFKTAPRGKTDNEEWRNLLTLKMNWSAPKKNSADVGLMYLQRGVRWIPSYRVTLGEKNMARVELQATLLNELTDIQNATMHLVIGVPSFMFKDTPDPISLQNSFAQLSPYFRGDERSGFAFSNALMAQGPAGPAGAYMREANSVADLSGRMPEIVGAGKNEDLFVFTVKDVSLKKGERMIIPVTEYSLPYKDIYTLSLPFAPPPEAYNNWNSDQQRQVSALLNAPKVQHKIRLTNKNNQPLTTAPALILKDGQVLAQGMMIYTAAGGQGDLDVTAVTDVRITKTDVETGRTPDAMKWNNSRYMKLDLRGEIELCNYRQEALEIEVTRYVLGVAETANNGGKIERVNIFEEQSFLPSGSYPSWWGWGNWGSWWHRLNGVSRITWQTRLEPEKEVQLNYTWHYFWPH